MPNLKDIKTRIGSVKKTKQITSAMKLVAAAKMKRATDAALQARPYREQLSEVLGRVGAAAGESFSDPLLETRDSVKSVLLVVLSSDRGLCGGFNNGLNRKVGAWVKAKEAAGIKVHVMVYGRKALEYSKREGQNIVGSTVDWTKMDKMDIVRPLSEQMVSGFTDGTYDEVYFGYNQFINVLTQEPTFDRIVPLAMDEAEGGATPADYRYEPNAGQILGTLLPLYLRTLVLQSFLETEAGEHAARMTAMDNATKNADELINALTLEFNRARQAAITTEIIEIVSGAAAL